MRQNLDFIFQSIQQLADYLDLGSKHVSDRSALETAWTTIRDKSSEYYESVNAYVSNLENIRV